jgi:hypothetical protein
VRERTVSQRITTRQKEIDRRLRAMYLYIKARLVAIADNIATVETAFHADIVLANGQTMSEWAKPQIREMYETGQMPPLLPGLHQPPQLPDHGRS